MQIIKMDTGGKQWYALQIQSRRARLASTALRGKGFEEFLPVSRVQRRWSDRAKLMDVPLFPGYLFCRFEPYDRLVPVISTPGVIGIVGANKKPTPVPEEEIEAVRRVLLSGLFAYPCPFVTVGSRVLIGRGPLTGIEGIVTNTDKLYRLIVSVTLLQRSVAVEIDREWAWPVTEKRDLAQS